MPPDQIQKNRIKFYIWPSGAIRTIIKKREPVKSGEMSRVIPSDPTKRSEVDETISDQGRNRPNG